MLWKKRCKSCKSRTNTIHCRALALSLACECEVYTISIAANMGAWLRCVTCHQYHNWIWQKFCQIYLETQAGQAINYNYIIFLVSSKYLIHNISYTLHFYRYEICLRTKTVQVLSKVKVKTIKLVWKLHKKSGCSSAAHTSRRQSSIIKAAPLRPPRIAVFHTWFQIRVGFSYYYT